MPTASILFYDNEGQEVARVDFRYSKDVYKGKTKVSGLRVSEVREAFKSKPNIYVSDMGGSAAGVDGGPRAWSWLVAVAGHLTGGTEKTFARYKVRNQPPKKLFRGPEELPWNAIP